MIRPAVRTLAALFSVAFISAACDEQPNPVSVDPAVASPQFAKGGMKGAPMSDDVMVWTTSLKPLNAHVTQRAVTGTATFIVNKTEETFTAITDVRGVLPDHLHPQHIHGFLNGENAVCPTPQADDDGDKIISVGEGAEVYGGILVPLDKDLMDAAQQIPLFPSPEDWDYRYEQTIPLDQLYDYPGFDAEGDFSFEKRHVVIHGALVDGEYNILLPVACGELRRTQ